MNTSRPKANLPSSMSLSRLPAQGMAQDRGHSSYLKSSGLKVCLSTLKIHIRSESFLQIKQKPLTGVPSVFGVFNSRYSQADKLQGKGAVLAINKPRHLSSYGDEYGMTPKTRRDDMHSNSWGTWTQEEAHTSPSSLRLNEDTAR